MAILNIVKEPDELLRKRSKEVTEFSARLHQLLDDMRETMQAAPGVGIAAVQVGTLYRACLVETKENGVVELINAVITDSSDLREFQVGCLSVPGKRGIVIYPHKVTVRAQDRTGKGFTMDFTERDAVCACHELDHFDGVLYIDKLVAPVEADTDSEPESESGE